jgi:hypothetical protein
MLDPVNLNLKKRRKMKTKCKICGKEIDISNWVADIEFNINGTIQGGKKEDIEIIEEYDTCRNCFHALKNFFYRLTENHKLIKRLGELR